ncbi:hypothetical protein KI387_007305, partial [Taxus chinensis]
DTLTAGSEQMVRVTASKKKQHTEDDVDLKSWMLRHGLSPCKVELRKRQSKDGKHRSIHYVAASEDLQPEDIAFKVPNSLVVTLERVLGNETIGETYAMLEKMSWEMKVAGYFSRSRTDILNILSLARLAYPSGGECGLYVGGLGVHSPRLATSIARRYSARQFRAGQLLRWRRWSLDVVSSRLSVQCDGGRGQT